MDRVADESKALAFAQLTTGPTGTQLDALSTHQALMPAAKLTLAAVSGSMTLLKRQWAVVERECSVGSRHT